jgi:uncharacterized membrane protein
MTVSKALVVIGWLIAGFGILKFVEVSLRLYVMMRHDLLDSTILVSATTESFVYGIVSIVVGLVVVKLGQIQVNN